jgi:hypothetical protein
MQGSNLIPLSPFSEIREGGIVPSLRAERGIEGVRFE